MLSCWTNDPAKRPTFKDVILQLEACLGSHETVSRRDRPQSMKRNRALSQEFTEPDTSLTGGLATPPCVHELDPDTSGRIRKLSGQLPSQPVQGKFHLRARERDSL